MGKLGYSSITLTDLTETIPVSLVLEASKNIQFKTGSLYNPDFSQEGEELIITPSLFLGQENLYIENYPEKFIIPGERKDGFIYYQDGEIDEETEVEKKYYYGSSEEGSEIWVDKEGKLHYKKNLTKNLIIEAYIQNFQNEEHSYVVPLVQAINPVQIILLDQKEGDYNLVITTDGRWHFDDNNSNPIEIKAVLYKGIDPVAEEDLTYEWFALTDGIDASIGSNSILEVTREMVHDEEKFLCKVKENITELEFSATVDIWDTIEKYNCIIISDAPLIVSEDFENITLTAQVYNEKSEIISSDSTFPLSYQWGIALPGKDGMLLEGETNQELIISSDSSFLAEKTQAFLIYCQVFMEVEKGNEDSKKLIAIENETIRFVPVYSVNITPRDFFVPTEEDGITIRGEKEYSFKFQLLDKNGNTIDYNTFDDSIEMIEGGENKGVSITFSQAEKGKWDFVGYVNINPDEKDSIWQNSEIGFDSYEFTYVYYGQQFTENITLIKNIAGKGNYSVLITSSSGSTLMSGDLETTLSAEVYYSSQKIEEIFYYKWLKDGINLGDKEGAEIKVKSSDFDKKVIYTCEVYKDKEKEILLGYAKYTLVDLTGSQAVSLMLETNLPQNIQTKKGDLYIPNFSEDATHLKITPSLFIGNNKDNLKGSGNKIELYYEISGLGNSEEKYSYSSTEEGEDFYVDIDNVFHIKKNLTQNISIEAYINNFVDESHQTNFGLIKAINPITIFFLESGIEGYTAIISSSEGREHFEEAQPGNITLSALLYKGNTPVTENLSYEWDIVTDKDSNDSRDDGSFGSLDFVHTEKTLSVARSDINGAEIFICKITLKDGSNLSFTASKTLRDFTDNYTNQILADSSLVLTPEKKTITLENQIWYMNQIINENGSSGRFEYEWSLLTKDNAQFTFEEKGKKITITVGENNVPKENFSILGKAIIDKKTTVFNYIDIKYSPITYTVEVSPKTIFVPVLNDGKIPEGTSFTKTIHFALVDENKKPLTYDENGSTRPNFIKGESSDNSSFERAADDSNNDIWSNDYIFTLDTVFFSDLKSDSKTYEFSYEYLGETRSEEFEVIKNYAGKEGERGFSGFTVDLTNGFHAFSGGEAIADPGKTASSEIITYYGDQSCKILEIRVEENVLYQNNEKGLSTFSVNQKNLIITAEATEEEGKVKITFTTGSGPNFLTEISPVIFSITIQDPNYPDDVSKEITFLKTFTYTINYNGKSYYLSTDHNTIKYSEALKKYSPQYINVSALVREANGEAREYENGKIVYSLDNRMWRLLSNKTLSTSKLSNNEENIYLRLYSSQANISEDSISSENLPEEYLLDMETLPILTSLEGYEIGGENLLRRTKDFYKWKLVGETKIETSAEPFSVLSFVEGSYAYSPSIEFNSEYNQKAFCLSFYIDEIPGDTLYAYYSSESNAEGLRKEIGRLNTSTNNNFIIEDSDGEWKRVYVQFILNKDEAEINGDVFYIHFSFNGSPATSSYSFKIKKPKLEFGNIPTAWSASPLDIMLEDVVGTNLLEADGLYLEINEKTEPKTLAILEPNTTYTFSFKESDWNGSTTQTVFYCRCRPEDESSNDIFYHSFMNSSSIAQTWTFITGDKTYRLEVLRHHHSTTYPDTVGTLVLEKVKLEKGEIATEFLMTSDYLKSLIDQLGEASGKQNLLISGLDGNYNTLTGTIGDLTKELSDLKQTSITMNQVEGKIEASTTELVQAKDYLSVLNKYVEIYAGPEEDESYIQIGTKTGMQHFFTKITGDKLGFYQNDPVTPVAYISSNKLMIESAHFDKSFNIGNLFVSITDEGVGFSWS